MIREVSKILTEEPRLEAVALSAHEKKLSIATLGGDENDRLAGRVSQAVSEGEEECGQLNPEGNCAVCGEKPSGQVQGSRVVVKSVHGSTLIEKQTCTTAISFWKWVALKWPKYAPREHKPFDAGGHDDAEWKTMALLAGGCLVFGLLGIAAESLFKNQTASIVLFLAAYLCGGWDAAKDAWERVRKAQLDVHFLMLAVAIGAASIGAWREGALLLFLFSASGAMEHYAMGRTKKAISALFREAPKTARVLRSGHEETIPVEDLVPGMIVLLTAGEQIPADLEVVKGETDCDESSLTGESRPVPKQPGDTALAGTMNLWGAIEGRVLRKASESALQKIITLIQDAQGMKAPSQKFTDKFGTGYTWAVLAICAVMFFVWWLAFKLPPFLSLPGTASAFYRTMTLLVVASPCALVLSVPSSILSAIASGARRGVLFRGGAAIETLAGVQVVALDKTGTLTSGDLTLEKLECLQGTEQEFHRIALSLARLSQHPLSRAIRKIGAQWKAAPAEVTDFETIAGKGLRATIDGHEYRLGSRKLAAGSINLPDDALPGGAEVWVAGPGLLGRMTFRDQVRPESRQTLAALNKLGIRTVMLTGDHCGAAELIGKEVGVDEIRSGLLPEQKVAAIQELKKSGAVSVAMVGDGVNDAPCIAAADVGVAMGARGSDAALEQAEVVLMNDRLENFLLARELSDRSRRIITQNIAVALGAVVIMMSAAFLFPIPLALGVAVHEGSTVLVVLNSLRLLLVKKS
ncbi:MAG: heavy metal translocating P-type ATPase [Terrimicrobiaceae bacterium]